MKKNSPKPKRKKGFLEMSLAELREATKEFDLEDVHPISKPVPPEVKAAHDRVMKSLKKRLRNRLGN